MDNKTIEICPHCGRLAWWPTFACVYCGCLLTDYKKWMKADDVGKAEILSKMNSGDPHDSVDENEERQFFR